MKILIPFLFCIFLFSCVSESPVNKTFVSWPDNLPVYDHIVIVMEENKDYEEIIDNPCAPISRT